MTLTLKSLFALLSLYCVLAAIASFAPLEFTVAISIPLGCGVSIATLAHVPAALKALDSRLGIACTCGGPALVLPLAIHFEQFPVAVLSAAVCFWSYAGFVVARQLLKDYVSRQQRARRWKQLRKRQDQ